MLKTLFQILIFVLFIIGNGYQSVITNYMMNPMKISHVKNLDSLFNSNYELYVTGHFNTMMENNSKYQAAKSDGRVYFHSEFKTTQYAFTYDCDFGKIYFRYESYYFGSTGFYVLPYTLELTFKTFHIGHFNPFFFKFQHLMMLSLEAGLIKPWINFYLVKVNEYYLKKLKIAQKIDDKAVLNLNEILPIFVILLIGLVVAFFTFLFEIFFHDCATQFDYYWRSKRALEKRRARKSWMKMRNRTKIIKVSSRFAETANKENE